MFCVRTGDGRLVEQVEVHILQVLVVGDLLQTGVQLLLNMNNNVRSKNFIGSMFNTNSQMLENFDINVIDIQNINSTKAERKGLIITK